MKKVIVRSLSGIVYVAFIIACILTGELWITLMAALFGAVGILELNSITGGYTAKRWPLLLLDMLSVILMTFILLYPSISIPSLWGVIVLRVIATLYIKDSRSSYRLAVSIFGYCYIGIPMVILTMMGATVPHLLLLLFILIWINDTGAFCVGSLLGRHKLFPSISPNKTWEGFFGGFIFCILIGLAISYIPSLSEFFSNGRLVDIFGWIIICGATSIFATYGDLIESLIKRNLGIKDSGHILPGHGGILDRIDSLLLVIVTVGVILLFVTMP